MTSILPLKTSLLFDTAHVGKCVEINERIRWVKIPTNTDPKDKIRPPEIIWWPCILYTSFTELRNDLDERLVEFRRTCKAANSKIEPGRSAVAYLLGFSPPLVRTVKNYSCHPVPKRGEDAFRLDVEGRNNELKDFYDFFIQSQDIASSSRAPDRLKAKFLESLTLAEGILAAENDFHRKLEMRELDEGRDLLQDGAIAKMHDSAVSLIGTEKGRKKGHTSRCINADLDNEDKTDVNPKPKNNYLSDVSRFSEIDVALDNTAGASMNSIGKTGTSQICLRTTFTSKKTKRQKIL